MVAFFPCQLLEAKRQIDRVGPLRIRLGEQLAGKGSGLSREYPQGHPKRYSAMEENRKYHLRQPKAGLALEENRSRDRSTPPPPPCYCYCYCDVGSWPIESKIQQTQPSELIRIHDKGEPVLRTSHFLLAAGGGLHHNFFLRLRSRLPIAKLRKETGSGG
jgi:hypothetical protein